MKTITLKLDLYPKIILTIIAVALLIIAFKPILPTKVFANPVGIVDVNIASVYGESYAYRTYGRLPIRGSVEIDGEVEVHVTNPER
ncbi:MAG: hypothetical protein Q8O10_09635 [candidate division Zixibacteria bacterium]|nr:hypothetical protein [candidate division Zixibacteria bacterium]